TRWPRDWSSDVCSSDLDTLLPDQPFHLLDRLVRVVNEGIRLGAGDERPVGPVAAVGEALSDERPVAGLPDALPQSPVRRPWRVRSEERRVGKEGKSGWW